MCCVIAAFPPYIEVGIGTNFDTSKSPSLLPPLVLARDNR